MSIAVEVMYGVVISHNIACKQKLWGSWQNDVVRLAMVASGDQLYGFLYIVHCTIEEVVDQVTLWLTTDC